MNLQTSLIGVYIKRKELSLQPGETGTEFSVRVTNRSDRFASFQLEILAVGVEPEAAPRWYRLAPEVASKKPPGDTTEFQVAILQSPVPGFAGLINLTVRVFSVELSAEERQVLRLTVEPGAGAVGLTLELPQPELQARPEEAFEIPVRLHNPSKRLLAAELVLLDLPGDWLLEPEPRALQLPPHQGADTSISGRLPVARYAVGRDYPFVVQVTPEGGAPVRAAGRLQILPTGRLTATLEPTEQRLPLSRPWLPQRQAAVATYSLAFNNASNLPQDLCLQVREAEAQPADLSFEPASIVLAPDSTATSELVVQPRRRWLGWGQLLEFEVEITPSDARVPLEPATLPLVLRVLPLAPRWLQGLTAMLLLVLAGWLWGLQATLRQHAGPVNVVQISGLGDRIASGSNDQTARDWRRQGGRLSPQGTFARAEKAVRTLRYRPVNNNQVALGLENGEIQLWNLLAPQARQPLASFSFQRDDRVLGLTFSRDARTLFSGHGSGLVLQWQLPAEAGQDTVERVGDRQFDFAVSDIALVGPEEAVVAIAGRYNQLVLWNWRTDTQQVIPYDRGGQDDYFTSLATAADQPYLLAAADNQGNISVWNLRPCLLGNGECELVDRWDNDGEPVRSLALTDSGCYLSSAGDDGRLMLWPLAGAGRRAGKFIDGRQVARRRTELNSTDIRLVGDRLLIAAGGNNHRVYLYREAPTSPDCQLQLPRTLAQNPQ